MKASEQRPKWFQNHGLLFRAPFLLTGVDELEHPTPASEPDVEIVHGTVPVDGGPESRLVGEYEIRGSDIVFQVPGTGRFLVRAGRRVIMDIQKNADDRLVRNHVAASAMAILLHQRRTMPLHASCVSRDGRAIAFVGESGTGKSTTGKLFENAGYDLVCDDVLTIDVGEHGTLARPANRASKLWPDAADMLALEPTNTESEHSGTAKQIFDPANSLAAGQHCLDAIVILRWIFPHCAKPQIYALSRMEALASLRKNIYREALVTALGLEGIYMDKLAGLIRAVPVLVLGRPYGSTALPDIPGTVGQALGYR